MQSAHQQVPLLIKRKTLHFYCDAMAHQHFREATTPGRIRRLRLDQELGDLVVPLQGYLKGLDEQLPDTTEVHKVILLGHVSLSQSLLSLCGPTCPNSIDLN